MFTTADTLAHLDPTFKLDLASVRPKNSPLPHGSMQNVLRNLTREVFMHRPYVVGDHPKFIDWRAFGRTDELMVREKHDVARATAGCVVEMQETMLFPDDPALGGARKLEIALRVAINLCLNHARTGDRSHLWLIDRSRPASGQLIYQFIAESSADWQKLFVSTLGAHFERDAILTYFSVSSAPPSVLDVLYWIGDGLEGDPDGGWSSLMRRGVYLQILSEQELSDTWFSSDPCYVAHVSGAADLGGEYQGKVLLRQHAYLTALERWQKKFKERLKNLGFSYHLFNEQTKIDYYERAMASAIVEM